MPVIRDAGDNPVEADGLEKGGGAHRAGITIVTHTGPVPTKATSVAQSLMAIKIMQLLRKNKVVQPKTVPPDNSGRN